jgi:hypothetical protein
MGGCVPYDNPALENTRVLEKRPGYLFVMGHMSVATYETPYYLPEKIKFELEKNLRLRGLKADPSNTEKRLVVHIVVSADYAGRFHPTSDCLDCYSVLTSRVTVTDARGEDILAETWVRSFNGGGTVARVSDFTEMKHAERIAGFLESLVR